MKNTILAFGILVCLFNSSCKKSEPYTCPTCSTTPEALAANDNSAAGIYKGTVVGSSGDITINIMNGGSTISAVMILDNTSVLLSSTATFTSGQAFFGVFTGTFNSQNVSITFSVDAAGGNATVVVNSIPGHPNASIVVFKELSTSLIQGFEGTFNGTSTGIFNMIWSVGTNKWIILGKDNTHTDVTVIKGDVNGNNISCTSCIGTDGNITGTISGDNVSGEWHGGPGESGNWTGKRTL